MGRRVRVEYHLETSKPYLYRETARGREYRVAFRRVLVAIPYPSTTPWAWEKLPGVNHRRGPHTRVPERFLDFLRLKTDRYMNGAWLRSELLPL